jgi:hypothetical protein
MKKWEGDCMFERKYPTAITTDWRQFYSVSKRCLEHSSVSQLEKIIQVAKRDVSYESRGKYLSQSQRQTVMEGDF